MNSKKIGQYDAHGLFVITDAEVLQQVFGAETNIYLAGYYNVDLPVGGTDYNIGCAWGHDFDTSNDTNLTCYSSSRGDNVACYYNLACFTDPPIPWPAAIKSIVQRKCQPWDH